MRSLALLLLLTVVHSTFAQAPRAKNVLFIAVDDLKPAIACAGDPHAITPNIDRWMKQGTIFTRAYCQQAVCSPSRTSLLTGRRPDTTKVYDLVVNFRDTIPDVVTLPQHFKNQGYDVRGIGKIFHGGLNDAASWSQPHENPKARGFSPEGQKLLGRLKAEAKAKGADAGRVRGLPVEAPDVEDDYLQDGWLANRGQELLKELKANDKPFFLAVGFLKPHLPFVAPKKYWDLYDPAKLPVAEIHTPPQNAPKFAPQFGGELRAYHQVPKSGLLSPELSRRLVHGYYAAVSFMDAQVGKLLAEIERQGLQNDTAIILWGDHGWHLGDHGIWCKHTNYEKATRSALFMSVPGQKAPGQTCSALVEFVDIYPTLSDLCGLQRPAGLEGHSFAPLLDDAKRPWKKAAFSQYPRSSKETGPLMGYAVRTDRFRYVEWRQRQDGKVIARELYDHASDPEESVNIADQESQASTIRELAGILQAGWAANQPPAP